MRKITFFSITLIPKKIIDFFLLKIEVYLSDFFDLPHASPLKAANPTPDLPKGPCKVIKLEKFQKPDKIKDSSINMDCTSFDDLSPEIKSIIMYNIMEVFSAKLPRPYHQRRRNLIDNSDKNKPYQILQNLN